MRLLEIVLIMGGVTAFFWFGFGVPLQLLEAHARDRGYSDFQARMIAGFATASWPGYLLGVVYLRWRDTRRASR